MAMRLPRAAFHLRDASKTACGNGSTVSRQDLRQDRSHAPRLSPHACSVMRLRSRLSHSADGQRLPDSPGLGLGEMAGLDKLELAESPPLGPFHAAYQVTRLLLPLSPLLRRRRRLICCAGMGWRDDDPLESRRRIEPGRRNEERVVRESALVGLLCASALASSWSTSAAISS